MPRLPPQFNGTPAVIELRQTKGTYERTLAKEKLKIQKIEAYSNAVKSSLLPIGIIGAGLGVGMSGYFIMLHKSPILNCIRVEIMILQLKNNVALW